MSPILILTHAGSRGVNQVSPHFRIADHEAHFCRPVVPHSAIVYPETTQDVVAVVEVANKYRIPVVPYSGGTSLEGHIAGVRALIQYLTRCFLTRIRANMAAYVLMYREWTRSWRYTVRLVIFVWSRYLTTMTAADADVVVQPGVGWMALNEELRDQGIPLFFPVRACSILALLDVHMV